jgi:hypothetical protein
MAGTKTRFGYLGSGGDEPPETGDSGAARTIIGRDLHLPQAPSELAPASTPLPPSPSQPVHGAVAPLARARIAAPMTEAVTSAIPERPMHRPQPSRFARFLGRWTTSGHFRASQTAVASELTDEDLKLPRETAARNLLLVLAIATLTFLITFAVMKWREPRSATPLPEPPAHGAAPPLLPATLPSAATSASAAAPPSPTTSAPLPPAAPSAAQNMPAPLAPTVRALRPHKSPGRPRASAVSMPPAHLQDELLPLNL